MLHTAQHHTGPIALRYPRGSGSAESITTPLQQLEIGKSRLIQQGQKVALLNFGPLLAEAEKAAEQLNATLVDMRFVKPLDIEQIQQLAGSHDLLVTVEDHAIQGGAGSSVGEYLHQHQLDCELLTLGIPDRWIEHAGRGAQLSECGLDATGIVRAVHNTQKVC